MTRARITVLTVILYFCLFSAVGNLELTKADTLAGPAHSTVNILSPENKTYYTNSLLLNLSVVEDHLGNSVKYSLDGSELQDVAHYKIVDEEPIQEEWFGQQYNYTQYTILCDQVFNNLSVGEHSLIIFNGYVDYKGVFYNNSEASILFAVQNQTIVSSTTPTVPEFPLLLVLPLFTLVLSVAMIIWHRKIVNMNNVKNVSCAGYG